MRILIAEDDLTSRAMLEFILSKWGHQPLAVEDGCEAWQAMQQADAPLLAILDWEMPGMDGLQVCRKIREANLPNPPYLIILTARDKKTDIVKGLDAGANDYISKPYNNNELRARISVGNRMLELQAKLIEARDALAHEAMHDPLTGALNRRAILAGLDKELKRSQRKASRLTIGLCDIDHFKRVNDTHGHLIGDEVLRRFTRAIQRNLRAYDLLGRYGGEEFLVIAPDSTQSYEKQLYERLRECVASDRTPTDLGEIGITVSIGVAGLDSGSTVDTLLAAADTALYKAKRHGRDQVCYATADMRNDLE